MRKASKGDFLPYCAQSLASPPSTLYNVWRGFFIPQIACLASDRRQVFWFWSLPATFQDIHRKGQGMGSNEQNSTTTDQQQQQVQQQQIAPDKSESLNARLTVRRVMSTIYTRVLNHLNSNAEEPESRFRSCKRSSPWTSPRGNSI